MSHRCFEGRSPRWGFTPDTSRVFLETRANAGLHGEASRSTTSPESGIRALSIRPPSSTASCPTEYTVGLPSTSAKRIGWPS